MNYYINKVAIITGAANGLGKALAIEFYAMGCNLALIDIDERGLSKLKLDLENGRQNISIHVVDVSQESQIISAKTEILQQHPKINILINNAGVSISQPFEQLDISDFKHLFDINFWGTVYCSRHFLPDLNKQPTARLVNIISGFALIGFPGKTSYGSSKSAIMGFTNSLKTETAGTYVKVSLVIPPPVNTDIVKNGKHISEQKKNNEITFLEKNGMQTDVVAKKIVAKIEKGTYRIIIGRKTRLADIAARLFPTFLHKIIGNNKEKFDFT